MNRDATTRLALTFHSELKTDHFQHSQPAIGSPVDYHRINDVRFRNRSFHCQAPPDHERSQLSFRQQRSMTLRSSGFFAFDKP